MKLFELAKWLKPAMPGSLSQAPFSRKLILMFTTITEAEWVARKDSAPLPKGSVLDSVSSRYSSDSVLLDTTGLSAPTTAEIDKGGNAITTLPARICKAVNCKSEENMEAQPDGR